MPRSSAAVPRLLFDEHFASLKDHRDPDKVVHSLRNVLLFALVAALCGATGWEAMEQIAQERAADLHDLLDPAPGVPSEDTFRRVFELLHPKDFAEALAGWTAALATSLLGEVVSFDGKTHRGTTTRRNGAAPTKPLHTLHAWACGQRLLLRQAAVEGAPGEVGGIVEMLKLLSIKGAVVTADANGCTQKVASTVLECEADYVLPVKGNRAPLHEAVRAAFRAAGSGAFDVGKCADFVSEGERSHGRGEVRMAWTLPASALPAGGPTLHGAQTLVHLVRARSDGRGKIESEETFYVSSLRSNAKALTQIIRAHWSVENQLHYVLDVVFHEDQSRVRDKTAAENLGIVRRIAATLLRKDTSKGSLVAKSRRAMLSPQYLRHLLTLGIDP